MVLQLLKEKQPQPAPPAKTEPQTVVVDVWHRGDFATITEALKAVKPGARILVRPGVYEEGIVLDKPVELLGDGPRDKIVIESSGQDTVLFKATVGRLANLTLRQTKGGIRYYGVDIAKGRLEVEDCDISSQSLTCVAIHGRTNPTLRRNRIHDGNGCGVIVSKNGQGTLEDNEIFANAFGVVIWTGGNPTLRRNRISKNGWNGIRVWDKGGGIFEDNDLRGNADEAWDIAPDCEANVQRSGNLE